MAEEYAKAVVAASARRRSAVGHLVEQLNVAMTLEDVLRIKADMIEVQTDYEASITAATVAMHARNDLSQPR